MRKALLLLFFFILSFSLNAAIDEKGIKKNYAKAKKIFSKEDFNLIKNRLDNYGFVNEYTKSEILSITAPEIKGNLSKIGIKENSVLLDALDVVVYLIKNKLISILFNIPFIDPIYDLIKGEPWSIFDCLRKLYSDEIDYDEKYGDKAVDEFSQSYKKDKITAVKQILKQILADLPKD
ncbi:exported protein A EppA [Borreliella bissettiae]|uniref:exported protein A EppA n=1 Tax=Borrelia bissettiae TaxID=64897 RepID=UPI001E3C6200|nr:exported protein A EppA [Borreliella bissettiae]MCD2401638.1 exported protein A EppA [Borreliella bissettiae]